MNAAVVFLNISQLHALSLYFPLHLIMLSFHQVPDKQKCLSLRNGVQ